MFSALNERSGSKRPGWQTCAPILVLGLLAEAGCATMPNAGRIEEVDVDSLYGTWRWMADDTGPRGRDVHDSQIVLNPDGTYLLIEVSANSNRASQGRFKIYQAVDQDSLDRWIEFQTAPVPRQRVFQFTGRDTLLLRDGDSGYAVGDGEIDLFVRASLGRLPDDGETYDSKPEPLTAPPPNYPEFARDADITGTVVLHVLVGENGRAQTIDVIQGVVGLNEAAVNAARKWVFKPAMKNGHAVAAWFELPMEFHR